MLRSANILVSVAATTHITTVMETGKAFEMTFLKNFPFTRSLLGSSARITEGMPMVSALMNVICLGMNGKSDLIIRKQIAKSKLYSVFTRKRDADLSKLFMVRLPSATALGKHAKLLSKSTSWLTFFAASLPAAMAIEQSDSLKASTSFTPSPVIATVCPLLLKSFINVNF